MRIMIPPLYFLYSMLWCIINVIIGIYAFYLLLSPMEEEDEVQLVLSIFCAAKEVSNYCNV